MSDAAKPDAIRNMDVPWDQAFIDGAYRRPHSQACQSRRSPIDDRPLPDVAACEPADVDDAVRAARAAFEDGRWHRRAPAERKELMLAFADAIETHADDLALLDCLSMGKPISAARHVDVPNALRCLRWFAEAIDKLYDECVPPQPRAIGTITREPVGVVGAITPWNYPLENVAWKIGPALAAGNCLVLKPAEQATLSALYLGRVAREAGLPDGVLNIVPGRGEIAGQALALHPDVDGIYFTGSTAVGRLMLQHAGASNLKRVALECGGKSAFVVLPGCKRLGEAAEVLASSMFSNAGQTCSAPSRLVVTKAQREPLLEALSAELPKYAPTNPLLADSRVGALVSHPHLQQILSYVQSGQQQGANLQAGGEALEPVAGGAYMSPTVFTQVRPDMRIAREEIFGPVLAVLEVADAAEAIAVANDSEYGLAAAVWSDDLDEAITTARALRAGFVHVNSYAADDITAPFGGTRQSGNGSKDKSLHALDDYSELKTTWIQLAG